MARQIELTQGRVALVDDDAYDHLNQWRWHLTDGYAVRLSSSSGASKRHAILMHRVIMDAPAEMFVDHINGDRLDNRRSNLRLCSKAENAQNTGPSPRNTSGYKGVHFHKDTGKWGAAISVNRKKHYLGLFATPEAAAHAYDAAAVRYHGAFAKLNFPQQES